MLATAAFANYQTMNGYEALKKTLLNWNAYSNCTADMNFTVSADGVELASNSEYVEIDSANKQKFSQSEVNSMNSEGWTDKAWYDGNKYYFWDSNTGEYYGWENDVYMTSSIMGISLTGNEKTDQKMIKFMELLADTVVGDLRNNFVCIEDNEDNAVYEVNLTSIQIPELINAGLGVMTSGMTSSYSDMDAEYIGDETKAFLSLGDDPVVESVKCKFDVAKDNTINSLEAEVVFAGTDTRGQNHTLSVNGNIKITNKGTTKVQMLDVNANNVKFYNDNGYVEDEYTVDTESAE